MTRPARAPDDGADAVTRRAAAELAAAERAQPVPDTLVPAVMRGVWAELRRPQMLPLPSDGGPAFVALHAAASTVERALDELVELQVHTCTLVSDPSADPSGHGPALPVRLVGAVEYGVDLAALTARARGVITRTVTEQFGRTAHPIDIDIVDVYLPVTDD